jgi:hypothetical protein
LTKRTKVCYDDYGEIYRYIIPGSQRWHSAAK